MQVWKPSVHMSQGVFLCLLAVTVATKMVMAMVKAIERRMLLGVLLELEFGSGVDLADEELGLNVEVELVMKKKRTERGICELI
jgi:hypothetical protein